MPCNPGIHPPSSLQNLVARGEGEGALHGRELRLETDVPSLHYAAMQG